MDLLTLTVGLPFAPLKGVLAIARVLEEEAERELYDPSRVRRELEQIEADQAEGRIPDDVAEERKQEALDRLIESG
jgi:gas vesicle protein GvpG